MGLDFGGVRIGIAFSDPTGLIASAYEVYVRKNLEADLKYLVELTKQQNADGIIIGLPVNMDGTQGYMAEAALAFGKKLEELSGISVTYVDERLSSVTAEELLIEAGMRREDRKKVIDKVAASIILQSYLDMKR